MQPSGPVGYAGMTLRQKIVVHPKKRFNVSPAEVWLAVRRRSGASSSAMAPVAHERGASTASAPAAATPAAAAPSGVPVHERARAKVPAATR